MSDMTASEWNARYPEGTRVLWLGVGRRTVGAAYDEADGRTVVSIAPGFGNEPTADVFVAVLEVLPCPQS